MNEKPIVVSEEQIQFLYNFAQTREQVNWSARYKQNCTFLTGLVPYIENFLDQTVRRVIYDPTSLRIVVGISGGLDSSVSATLAAEAIKRAREERSVQNPSLVMIAFKGMSEEDLEFARRFAESIRSRYNSVPIDYQERDLTKLLKEIDQYTDDLITASGRPKIYSGELTSRLITSLLMEYGNKTRHCILDSTNGTEYILGELVIGAGAECAPLADFYKSQVYDLAELIGVPQFIIDRPPINSTWGHNKVATYFREIPDDLTPRDVYQVLDPVLFYLFERKNQPSTVTHRLGHSLEFVTNVATRLKNQDHRRDIPFFVVNERFKRYGRTVTELSNETMKKFIEGSLAISE